jgi:hypothetical protein
MFRFAASEWLVERGVEMTAPEASRAHPGG